MLVGIERCGDGRGQVDGERVSGSGGGGGDGEKLVLRTTTV